MLHDLQFLHTSKQKLEMVLRYAGGEGAGGGLPPPPPSPVSDRSVNPSLTKGQIMPTTLLPPTPHRLFDSAASLVRNQQRFDHDLFKAS